MVVILQCRTGKLIASVMAAIISTFHIVTGVSLVIMVIDVPLSETVRDRKLE